MYKNTYIYVYTYAYIIYTHIHARHWYVYMYSQTYTQYYIYVYTHMVDTHAGVRACGVFSKETAHSCRCRKTCFQTRTSDTPLIGHLVLKLFVSAPPGYRSIHNLLQQTKGTTYRLGIHRKYPHSSPQLCLKTCQSHICYNLLLRPLL